MLRRELKLITRAIVVALYVSACMLAPTFGLLHRSLAFRTNPLVIGVTLAGMGLSLAMGVTIIDAYALSDLLEVET